MEIKSITIKQEVTNDGTTTIFESEKMNDFEIIGLLSYYLDAYKVNVLRKSEKQHKKKK